MKMNKALIISEPRFTNLLNGMITITAPSVSQDFGECPIKQLLWSMVD